MAAQHTRRSGFTLVEMMVVVAIIALLVTVSIFGFGQWRKSVAQGNVKSDLNGVAAAMDSARTWNNGYPVYTAGSALPASLFPPSKDVTLTYVSGSTSTYCVNAVSISVPAVIYHLDAAGGNKTPVTGGC